MAETVVFGCDHAGLSLKGELFRAVETLGYKVLDLGTFSEESVDYPDYAIKVVQSMADHPKTRGILICGTGIGMSIAANRHVFIRAAVCTTEYETRVARQHNNINILCLGGRVIGAGVARGCLEVFLTTPFEGGRHERRLEKLS